MRGKVHAVVGLAAGVVLMRASGASSLWLPVAGVVGALLPDIDEPNATVARLPRIACDAVREALEPAASREALALPLRLAGRAGEAVTMALAAALKAGLGHRGPIHSLAAGLGCTLVATLVSTLVAASWTAWPAGAAFGLGYVGHLVGDALTDRGVPLWWPVSGARVCLGPPRVRACICRLLG